VLKRKTVMSKVVSDPDHDMMRFRVWDDDMVVDHIDHVDYVIS
jgi:hypothetical protein